MVREERHHFLVSRLAHCRILMILCGKHQIFSHESDNSHNNLTITHCEYFYRRAYSGERDEPGRTDWTGRRQLGYFGRSAHGLKKKINIGKIGIGL